MAADNLLQYLDASVPTTNIWDVGELQDIDVKSPEFKELLVRLYQNLNNMALITNIKTSGYYDTSEFTDSNLWFPNPLYSSQTSVTPTYRPEQRLVINFGALPNTAAKSVNHNIVVTAMTSFTKIYACATNPGTAFIPIPYASPVLANNISIDVNATQVTITTGSNRTAFTTCYVILEYLQT